MYPPPPPVSQNELFDGTMSDRVQLQVAAGFLIFDLLFTSRSLRLFDFSALGFNEVSAQQVTVFIGSEKVTKVWRKNLQKPENVFVFLLRYTSCTARIPHRICLS